MSRRPSKDENPLPLLLRRVFGSKLVLEKAVRAWAAVDPTGRAAVQAIDRRRLSYVESLLTQSGLSAAVARARAQILYWAFFGFALSDQPLAEGKTAGRARRVAADGLEVAAPVAAP